jgi:hypothetical protein
MDHPIPASRLVTDDHCTHLRHKGMYVQSDPSDPFASDGLATAYWCVLTQRGLGPDGQPVNNGACRGDRCCCEH